jgi:hypothetical protein
MLAAEPARLRCRRGPRYARPMLGWFRARGRRIAAAAFVLLVATTVANHGLGGHDSHGPWLVAHDANAHAFTDGSSATHGDVLNCVLCHVTRTVRPTVEVTYHAPASDDRTQVVRRPALRVPAVFPAAEPPLRSPPVSL